MTIGREALDTTHGMTALPARSTIGRHVTSVLPARSPHPFTRNPKTGSLIGRPREWALRVQAAIDRPYEWTEIRRYPADQRHAAYCAAASLRAGRHVVPPGMRYRARARQDDTGRYMAVEALFVPQAYESPAGAGQS